MRKFEFAATHVWYCYRRIPIRIGRKQYEASIPNWVPVQLFEHPDRSVTITTEDGTMFDHATKPEWLYPVEEFGADYRFSHDHAFEYFREQKYKER